MSEKPVNIRDINPLEHITSDIAKSQANFESILNGLVMWNSTTEKNVTVRLQTDSEPFFVDYTFPSRTAYAKETSKFMDGGVRIDSFDYEHRLVLPAVKDDNTTLRLSADAGDGASWKLYEDAYVHNKKQSIGEAADGNYPEGSYIRLKDSTDTYSIYYATTDISAGDVLAVGTNITPAIVKWRNTDALTYGNVPGMIVIYQESPDRAARAYNRKNKVFDMSTRELSANWVLFADRLMPSSKVIHGRPYLFEGEIQTGVNDLGIYIYTGPNTEATAEGIKPYLANGELDTTNWYGPIVVIAVTDVTTTSIIRHKPTTDINGYLLRSNTDIPGEVSVLANVAVHGGETEPHRGVGVYNTCNYSLWPDTNTPAWRHGRDYSGSDSYTAKMVFHHGDENTKMTNIINYDGPDLDRGLGVYLPVNDTVVVDGVEKTVTPKDGAMFEFMFRIWPNASLSGNETADLTINKSQIYVYTLLDGNDTEHNANIIAKFSMARVTNFYVWSENIAVPNRPVFYKAKFIFSKTDNEWKTYDYYQIPDHVFWSPRGFVPPDIESTGEYNGLETAGFPLMQDPFGGMNMGRIVLKNRIDQTPYPDDEDEDEEVAPCNEVIP